MIEYIKSKDVRDYLEKIGHKFTDFEIATLVYNSGYTIREIIESLIEIRDRTDDENLKTQINERLEFEKMQYHALVTNDGDCIYVIEEFDERANRDYSGAMFTAHTKAYEYAAKYVEGSFNILKQKLDVLNDDDDYEVGKLYYNDDKSLDSYWSSECENEKVNPHCPDLSRFEFAHVAIPHPFRKGDIVKRIDSKTNLAYVVTDFTSDYEMFEFIRKRKNSEFYDCTDITIQVETNNSNDTFFCEPQDVRYFEFYTPDETCPNKDVIETMSMIYKGKYALCCLNDILLKKGK